MARHNAIDAPRDQVEASRAGLHAGLPLVDAHRIAHSWQTAVSTAASP